jgi:hypothetical protein
MMSSIYLFRWQRCYQPIQPSSVSTFTPNSTSDRLTRIEILDEPEKLLLLFVPRQGLWVDGPLLNKPCTELGVFVGSTVSTSWNISTSSQGRMSQLFS